MFSREEFVEEGIVESVRDGTAMVRIMQKGGCNECSARVFCSSGKENNLVTAKDPLGVKAGEEVRITVPGKYVTSASTLIYGIPLVLLLAGIISGQLFFIKMKELLSALLGLGLVAVYGLLMYFYLRKRDLFSVMPRIDFVKKT